MWSNHFVAKYGLALINYFIGTKVGILVEAPNGLLDPKMEMKLYEEHKSLVQRLYYKGAFRQSGRNAQGH